MFSGLRLYAAIGTGLLIAAILAWGLRVDHLRASWKGKFESLTEQAAGVLTATRIASENDKLTWENVPGQVVALGESNRDLKASLDRQNQTVLEMAEEARRLRADAERLQEIARRAEAQRRAALDRLSDMAATPGTREDCMQLLEEAEEALDLVREAGL